MATKSKIAQQFASLFIKALTDQEGGHEKSTKEKEADYYRLTYFIHGIEKTQDLDACLKKYLEIYSAHLPDDRRSKFIFVILLTGRINRSSPDDKYLEALSADLAGSQKPFPQARPRFEGPEAQQKHEILRSLNPNLQTKK